MQPTVTLHLGDCLDVLPTLAAGSVDAVITDPPYGIDFIHGGGRSLQHGWRDFRGHGDWDKERPDKVIFDEMLRIGKQVIIWGGNYFTDWLPPSSQWLMWDKGQRDFSLADGELAWTNQDKAVRIFSYHRSAMLKENGLHPTQKPLALMRWCIELLKLPTGAPICDPFMGSGTTGAAAAQLGFSFLGVERDPGYFAIAQRRIEQARAQLALPLFGPQLT